MVGLTKADYAVFRNPYHCDQCGWQRVGPLMSREQALIASRLNRRLLSHHGWKARRVGRSALRSTP